MCNVQAGSRCTAKITPPPLAIDPEPHFAWFLLLGPGVPLLVRRRRHPGAKARGGGMVKR